MMPNTPAQVGESYYLFLPRERTGTFLFVGYAFAAHSDLRHLLMRT